MRHMFDFHPCEDVSRFEFIGQIYFLAVRHMRSKNKRPRVNALWAAPNTAFARQT